jgi:hypothetical protein
MPFHVTCEDGVSSAGYATGQWAHKELIQWFVLFVRNIFLNLGSRLDRRFFYFCSFER